MKVQSAVWLSLFCSPFFVVAYSVSLSMVMTLCVLSSTVSGLSYVCSLCSPCCLRRDTSAFSLTHFFFFHITCILSRSLTSYFRPALSDCVSFNLSQSVHAMMLRNWREVRNAGISHISCLQNNIGFLSIPFIIAVYDYSDRYRIRYKCIASMWNYLCNTVFA